MSDLLGNYLSNKIANRLSSPLSCCVCVRDWGIVYFFAFIYLFLFLSDGILIGRIFSSLSVSVSLSFFPLSLSLFLCILSLSLSVFFFLSLSTCLTSYPSMYPYVCVPVGTRACVSERHSARPPRSAAPQASRRGGGEAEGMEYHYFHKSLGLFSLKVILS